MAFSATNILEILDKGADTYDFPMLDNNYFYLGKEKLLLFRNGNEWLIVFQEISFSIKAKKFSNIITVFGNYVDKNGIILNKEIISESPNDKMFDDNYKFLLNPLRFKVIIKGTEREFNPTKNDYKNLGIDIDDDKMPNEAKIIRYLTGIIPNELLFTADELLEICGRKNSNLDVFMVLEDWYHPDLINDEKPSETLCFQSLAEALEKNDRSLFKCPEEEYNTHWSNWEWYKED